VGGIPDEVSLAMGKLLPTKALAEEAEAAGLWWNAALRWNVHGARFQVPSVPWILPPNLDLCHTLVRKHVARFH
jgi:hypothetical protein